MRFYRIILLVAFGWTFIAQAPKAVYIYVKCGAETKSIIWTNHGDICGTTNTGGVPIDKTFSAPAGTTDWELHNVTIKPFPYPTTKETQTSGYPISSVPTTYALYYDANLDTLYVAYDINGPAHPIFCASPPIFNPVTEIYACSDPNPTEPIEYGSITINFTDQIPTLTEWGLIIFGVLLVGVMTWAALRRKRGATIGI